MLGAYWEAFDVNLQRKVSRGQHCYSYRHVFLHVLLDACRHRDRQAHNGRPRGGPEPLPKLDDQGEPEQVRQQRVESNVPFDCFQVAQSLLWLVAYFWHSTRPALAILLDADLKTSITNLFTFSWCQQQQSADSQDLMLPLQIRQQDKDNACIVLKKANLGEKNHQKSSLENANAEDFEKEQCLSPCDQNCV